jgi:long-chain-fatty-acyl-CoA reductase
MPPVLQPRSADELRQAFAGLRNSAEGLAALPLSELLAPLDRLAAMWSPGTARYEKACEMLTGVFSRRAVEAALQSLALGMRSDVLAAELQRELGRADLLEKWEPDAHGVGFVRGYPLGVVAQVLAGNVFLGGVVAVAQSLLTRNPVVLKLSREDSGFTALFAESLLEADPSLRVASAVRVCRWESKREELNAVVREEADAVVVWGGAAAVAAYPQEKCRGRVIHYGPRLGVGVVLHGFGLEAALPALAWDIALWEQRACSSPRVLFVRDADGSGTLPRRVAEGLNAELERVRAELPPRPLTLDEKAEVLSFRELAYWSGEGAVCAPDGSMSHTVLCVPNLPADIPLGARTVLVVPFRKNRDLPELLRPLRDHLQTAVLAAPPSLWQDGVELLVKAGCTQVTAPGAASARVVGLPHEGEFALRRLVKLVGVDLGIGPLACPHRDPKALAVVGAALS